jgi:hypothetical protein
LHYLHHDHFIHVEIMPIGSSITADRLNKLDKNLKDNVGFSETTAQKNPRPSTSFHAVRESLPGPGEERKKVEGANPIPKIDIAELGQQAVTPAAGMLYVDIVFYKYYFGVL